jgi:hypothetical protein
MEKVNACKMDLLQLLVGEFTSKLTQEQILNSCGILCKTMALLTAQMTNLGT